MYCFLIVRNRQRISSRTSRSVLISCRVALKEIMCVQAAGKNFGFKWSLKPFLIVSNALGTPLDLSKFSYRKRTLTLFLSVFILGWNLATNGPGMLNFEKLKKQLHFDEMFESPYIYMKAHPDGLITLTKRLMSAILFCYSPVVHVTFLVKLLFTRQWNHIWKILEHVENQMKLDGEFYRRCRKYCLLPILFLILASIVFAYY